MNWFLSIVVGLLTGIVAALAAGFLGNLNVRWYRISGFEGGAGYYVLMFALLGGMAGFAIGLVASRLVAGWQEPGFWKALGISVGSTVALTVAICVLCRLAADIRPEIDGHSLDLQVEVRTPRGFTPEFERQPGFSPTLYLEDAGGRTKAYAAITNERAVEVDGHWVFSAMLDLSTSASGKRIRAYFNKENDALFVLPLRGHPGKADLEWSSWQQSGWRVDQARPSAEDSFWLRYRVVLYVPPAPEPTQADLDARRDAEEQAAFEAIPADAPLTTFLPFTRYGAPEGRMQRSLEYIQARDNLPAELEPIVTGDDNELAATGLRMIGHLELFDPGLNAVVAAAGRKVIAMIQKFNTTPVDQDPGMQLAADISVRFGAWMVAVRTLRTHAGGDFTAELGEILVLSRVREDSHCMRTDVRRVASYYMNEWTGLAPLPGDPKPR